MAQDTADEDPAELSFESFAAQAPGGESLGLVERLIRSTLDGGNPDVGVLEAVISRVFVGIKTDPSFELAWFFPKPAKDYRPLHALNACRLAMHFGIGSGMDDSRVVQLGIVGLFYDIGMWHPAIPDPSQPRDFTREEIATVEKAAAAGAAMLEKARELDKLCAVVAREHHERADGTGYPSRSKADAQHPYSRLFQVMDSFLGMIEPRAFRKAISPVEAMQRLAVQAHRGYFHEPTFRDWMKVIGLYPVGSFVKLNTGELAVVAKSNGERPRNPVVNVVADELLDFRSRPMPLDLAADPAFAVAGAFTQFPRGK